MTAADDTDELVERLIEGADGRWCDGEFRIDGQELTKLVRAALAARSSALAAPEGWKEALQFYADKQHFSLSDEDAWDTVSGENQNFWCDESGTATVEDGRVAAMALAGTPFRMGDENDDAAPQPPALLRQFLDAAKDAGITHLPANFGADLAQAIASRQPDPTAAKEGEPRCPTCNGNDGDAPCAYPSEGQAGCIRDKRLAVPEPAIPLAGQQGETTRATERAALVAEVGECCLGSDPLCGGGCLVEAALVRRAAALTQRDQGEKA